MKKYIMQAEHYVERDLRYFRSRKFGWKYKNPGEKPYREKPDNRQALHFLTPAEKSPSPFCETIEKSPLLFFSDRGKKPFIRFLGVMV